MTTHIVRFWFATIPDVRLQALFPLLAGSVALDAPNMNVFTCGPASNATILFTPTRSLLFGNQDAVLASGGRLDPFLL